MKPTRLRELHNGVRHVLGRLVPALRVAVDTYQSLLVFHQQVMDHEGDATVLIHYEEISRFHVVRNGASSAYANIMSVTGQNGLPLVQQ